MDRNVSSNVSSDEYCHLSHRDLHRLADPNVLHHGEYHNNNYDNDHDDCQHHRGKFDDRSDDRSATRFAVQREKELVMFLSVEAGCFYAHTNITLADGSLRSLDALKAGDEVRVYTRAGKIRSSRVLTIFRHYRSSVRLLEISTNHQDKPLRLTPSHSLLIQSKGRSSSSGFRFDFASTIEIGDHLRLSDSRAVRVVNIKEVVLTNQTISTPITFEGTILANELIASCYATFSHSWMHFLSTPVRYWYQLGTFARLNRLIVETIDFYARL